MQVYLQTRNAHNGKNKYQESSFKETRKKNLYNQKYIININKINMIIMYT